MASWESLRQERIRVEEAIAKDSGVTIHGSGGDLEGVAADISYEVARGDGKHTYMITIEELDNGQG